MTPIQLSESDWQRFHSKVMKSQGCWRWCGETDNKGYGRMKVKRKWLLAPRIAYYERWNDSEALSKFFVCHHCDNPICVNPYHLFLGTSGDNTRDAMVKGRMARGDKNGARLYPEKLKRGSDVAIAKLGEADVRRIRAIYSTGESSYKKLAYQYGVVKQCIAAIIKRQTWKHI